MSIISTKRNTVYAYEPEEGDAFVKVTWHGPPDQGNVYRRAFNATPQPIEEYQDAVDWAVSMADQMLYPLHVLPMRPDQVFTQKRLQRLVDNMTGQERGELRRLVVTTAAKLLRDCTEVEIRQDAYGVLVKMGVVQDD